MRDILIVGKIDVRYYMNIIIFISNHKTTSLLAVREIKGHKEGWKLRMEAEVEIVQIS